MYISYIYVVKCISLETICIHTNEYSEIRLLTYRYYREFVKYCVFARIPKSLPTLRRHYSAAIGCTKNNEPIGVTVHSHCIESFKVPYNDVGEGGVAVNCKKNTIFPEHSVCISYGIASYSFL